MRTKKRTAPSRKSPTAKKLKTDDDDDVDDEKTVDPPSTTLEPPSSAELAPASSVSEEKKTADSPSSTTESIEESFSKGNIHTTQDFLQKLELDKFSQVFQENEVELQDLLKLSKDDLAGLSIPLGPRTRIFDAIQRVNEKKKAAETQSSAETAPVRPPLQDGISVKDCIAIHEAIHSAPKTGKDQKPVRLSNGQEYPVVISSNKCRSCKVGIVNFMEQNTTKASTYSRRAKQGHKLTWLITKSYRWGLIADGRVEIDSPCINHDPDYEKQQEERSMARTDKIIQDQEARINTFTLHVEFPEYWAPSTTAIQQFDLTSSSEEWKKVSKMFQKTIEKDVQIEKISRIQNQRLWPTYFLKKQFVIENNPGGPEKISGVLTDLIDPKANEFYLFHGCNPSVVDKIIEGGFDERLSSLLGLFGSGVYFAENASKSGMYTHTADCEQVGAVYKAGQSKCTCRDSTSVRKMFVSRVTVGTPWIRLVATDRENPLRRPPERPAGSGDSNGGRLYDSVMGESKKHDKQAFLPYREFIVYDRQQCYPEYILHFKFA